MQLVQTLTAPFYTARWSWEYPAPTPHLRDQIKNGRRSTYISLTDLPTRVPCLEVIIEQFFLQDPSGAAQISYGIPPHEGPKEAELDLWIEDQIRFEDRSDFEGLVENLLRVYVTGNDTVLSRLTSDVNGVKERLAVNAAAALLQDVKGMTLAWRVWSSSRLFVRRTSDSLQAFAIGDRIAAIGDRLRFMAAKRLAELERRVLESLDQYLTAEGNVKQTAHPNLWSGLNVAVWVALMQLMLLYRKSLNLQKRRGESRTWGLDALSMDRMSNPLG
jgi:hypothetical protein